MLYTRKGDDGKTKTFGCDQRVSKSSAIAEALGSLDEINSYLGLCKVKSQKDKFSKAESPDASKEAFREKILEIQGQAVSDIIHEVQKNLFIIQAELAGASMHIDENKVKEMEKIIDMIEHELPPIKSFFISGGTELAVYFDIARTIARRAERRVIEVSESEFSRKPKDKEEVVEVGDFTKAYLNRLSSLLYALARLSNHKFGINEESPDYK